MTVPLSLVSTAFKYVWLKYKLDKTIKKRDPYIRALIKTKEGRAVQKAILESPGSELIYIAIEHQDCEYLNTFEDEQLLDVTTRGKTGDGSVYAFKLTQLGEKYFSN